MNDNMDTKEPRTESPGDGTRGADHVFSVFRQGKLSLAALICLPVMMEIVLWFLFKITHSVQMPRHPGITLFLNWLHKMKLLQFLTVIWELMWGLSLEGPAQGPDLFMLLGLPLHVAFAGEIVLLCLMVRSPENRERLLLSAILLPLHALLYPLLLAYSGIPTAYTIYPVSAPILALGLIIYLICLCCRKRMNRCLWAAVAVWFLYFASVGCPILFFFLLGRGLS